jgi:hypothetical protein
MTELEEAKNSLLYGRIIGDMTKDELIIDLMKAHKYIEKIRREHTNEIIKWIER